MIRAGVLDLSFSFEFHVSGLGYVKTFGPIGSHESGLKFFRRALFFLWEPRQIFYKKRKWGLSQPQGENPFSIR